jgi:transposase
LSLPISASGSKPEDHGPLTFKLTCDAKYLACPLCHKADQSIHDRLERQWRHLDFFQYEAWLHAEVPRIVCSGCGKTTQMEVPWAHEGSGFTLLFEALALSLCQDLPVRQAAQLLRCNDKQLWRRIEHYVQAARKLDDMSEVKIVGIDETSLRKGQNYITVVHPGSTPKSQIPGFSLSRINEINGLRCDLKTFRSGNVDY